MTMTGMSLHNNIKFYFSLFLLSVLISLYNAGVYTFASLTFLSILFSLTIYKPRWAVVLFFLYLPFYYVLKDLSSYLITIGRYNQILLYIIKDIIIVFLVFSLVVRLSNYREKIKDFFSNRYMLLYLCFLCLLILNSLLHFEGSTTILGLRSYLFPSLFIVFAFFFINEKNISFIFRYTAFISVVFAIVGIYQHYIDKDFLWEFFLNSKYVSLSLLEVEIGKAMYRAISLIGHPNNLGLFLAMGAMISFVNIFDRRYSFLFFMFFLLSTIGLLTTGTRMSFLSLLIGILFFLHYKFKKKYVLKILLFMLFILGVTLIYFSGFGERFADINITTNPRLLAWSVIITELQNPFILLLGQGIGHHLADDLKIIDSSFFEMLREGGIFIFVIFSLFIGKLIFSKSVKCQNQNMILLVKSISVVLLMQMLTNSFLTGLFGYYLWLCLGILIVLLKIDRNYRYE